MAHWPATSANPAVPQPTAKADGRWFAVGLLSFLYAASFIDRMILALLMDPVRAELALSETQLSLLFGLAFGAAYVLAGLPLGHLADRGNRRRLLVVGVLLWSVATASAAFAQGFGSMLIARAGVGIGEAVLTPIAVSLIGDLFPRDERALPMSLYMTVGAVMGSGSLIVGGGAFWLAIQLKPLLGMEPWRLTFILVALPGLVGAAVAALMLREPKRSEFGVTRSGDMSLGGAISHLLSHVTLYLGFFIGVGCVLALAMALLAWGPTMLVREHSLLTAQAGALFGVVAASGSVIGTLSVPFFLRRETANATRRICLLAASYAVGTIPIVAFGLTSTNVILVLCATGVAMAGLSASAVLPALLVQLVALPRLRARTIAVYLLISNVISLGLGPVLVPLARELNGPQNLADALSLTAWASLAAALFCYAAAFLGTRQISGRNHDLHT